MTEYYAQKLEEGLQFQDFIMTQLHQRGIVLQPISSRREQRRGENMLGLEIKFDQKQKDTGNLYIETHEKTNPNNSDFVCSGILRNDNSWLYGIGDYSRFWIFAKADLRRAYARISKGLCGADARLIDSNPTSRGFIISCKTADIWAAKVVNFNK